MGISILEGITGKTKSIIGSGLLIPIMLNILLITN